MPQITTRICVAAVVGVTLAAGTARADGDSAVERTGVIAFEAKSGLYVIDANGGTPRKIPRSKPGDGDPVWSPDGLQLSFDRKREGSWDIWVMNAYGSGQRQLTFSPQDDDYARWAPHGRSLVFQSTRRVYSSGYAITGRAGVYAISLRTGTARRVESPGDYPDWAPGRRIMFAYEGELFTVRPYGADRRPLASQPSGAVVAALVSNNGQRIAYISEDYRGILVARSDGSQWREITSSRFEDDDPSWSPNDEWIAFDRKGDIYVVRPDGSELTRLTTLVTACCPSWGE